MVHKNFSNIFPNCVDSVLAYCPERRREVWRYLSYMLVHSSTWHLAFNLGVQTLLGKYSKYYIVSNRLFSDQNNHKILRDSIERIFHDMFGDRGWPIKK